MFPATATMFSSLSKILTISVNEFLDANVSASNTAIISPLV